MSFVRAFIKADRWRDWPLVIPIYDGRMCPECGALCVGKKSRRAHLGWHIQRTDFDSKILDAVRQLAVAAGLNVVEPHRDDAPDGLYDYDDEGLDDRLDRKARQVAELDDYDEEDDDGED
jgi:hypothetical protein